MNNSYVAPNLDIELEILSRHIVLAKYRTSPKLVVIASCICLGPSLNFLYFRLVDELNRIYETYYTGV